MANPTLVVLTDRNDLDDQLFGTFARCHELLRQTPVQADEPRATCASCSTVASGGVVFTTIQKFVPDEKGDAVSRCSPTGATSSSSPTRPTAASTTSSTASPAHLRDALPERLLHRLHRHAHRARPTRTPAPSSATTSTSTTSSGPSRTARPSRSTTRAAWPRSSSTTSERPTIDAEFEEVTEGEEDERRRAAQAQVGAARGDGRHREAARAGRRRTSSSTSRSGRDATGRQGDDRLHEPPHLRGPVRRDRRSCARSGTTTTTTGAIKVVMTGSATDPLGVAAAHPHQGSAARRSTSALQGPRRSAQDRDRPRHVADRLRRPVPAHDVRRQADAGPRADAGHRPREPRLPRQAGRAGRRLPRPRRRTAQGARRLHRAAADTGKPAFDQDEAVARHAGEVRGRAAACSTASTTRRSSPAPPRERLALLAGGAGARPRRRTSGRERFIAGVVAAVEGVRARRRRTRRRSPIRDEVALLPGRPGRARQDRRAVAARPDGGARPRGPPDRLRARSRPTRSSTSSPRPAWRSRTSRSSPTSSSPRCAGCRSGTSPSSCCGSCSTTRSRPGAKRNLVQSRPFSEMLEKSIRRYQNRAIETAAGHRGADRAGQGDARGARSAARTRA